MNGLNIEEMIARYGGEILRLCLLYLGDRQLAEDAFQETFVKAWKGRDAFRGESSEKTWLSRIAVNTCRDMLRSGAPGGGYILSSACSVAPDVDPAVLRRLVPLAEKYGRYDAE